MAYIEIMEKCELCKGNGKIPLFTSIAHCPVCSGLGCSKKIIWIDNTETNNNQHYFNFNNSISQEEPYN